MAREKIKPQKHLTNILKSTKSHHPNFSLFLGAGASVTSGVITSKELIEKWRKEYLERYKGKPDYCIEKQNWHGKPVEYAVLFEMLYDQPSQRREYVESLLEKAKPSWGYIYLVNLIRQNTFNTIFTTNFDDLLNEACYQYSSDVRPIVCAHDSSIRNLRITSHRPKIIKLHGDYLFDDIKNTLSELESLEDNMRAKFKQFATEYGMIVIGYSGNDQSIMQPLNALLRSDTYFPHGIYWCVKSENDISNEVEVLARFPRFNIVQIDGFDEFIAEIHTVLEHQLQPEMSDPYGALASKLNSLLDDSRISLLKDRHQIINRDISMLANKINEQHSIVKTLYLRRAEVNLSAHLNPIDIAAAKATIPFKLLAEAAKLIDNIPLSIEYIKEQINIKPTIEAFQFAFELTNKESIPDEYVDQIVDLLLNNISILDIVPDAIYTYLIELMNGNHFSQVEKLLTVIEDRSNRGVTKNKIDYNLQNINRCLNQKLSGKELTNEDIDILKKIEINNKGTTLEIGAIILQGNYEEALSLLLKEEASTINYFLKWPIIRPIPRELIDDFIQKLKRKKDRESDTDYVKIG